MWLDKDNSSKRDGHSWIVAWVTISQPRQLCSYSSVWRLMMASTSCVSWWTCNRAHISEFLKIDAIGAFDWLTHYNNQMCIYKERNKCDISRPCFSGLPAHLRLAIFVYTFGIGWREVDCRPVPLSYSHLSFLTVSICSVRPWFIIIIIIFLSLVFHSRLHDSWR